MRKIAVYIVVSTLLALGACDLDWQRAAVAAAAQVGAGIAFATVEPPQDTIPTVVRRVWKEADFLISPSPDGRFVSLTDWNTGDVAVRDLETGEVRHVTHNPMPWVPGFALFPHTSPGGSQIAYSWWLNEEAEFELRIVDWDGSEPRTLLANEPRILALAWAPDGRHILVIRRQLDASIHELALVATADGSETVLVSTGPAAPHSAAFSPDGHWLAYASNESGQYEVYVVGYPEPVGKRLMIPAAINGKVAPSSTDCGSIINAAADHFTTCTPCTLPSAGMTDSCSSAESPVKLR